MFFGINPAITPDSLFLCQKALYHFFGEADGTEAHQIGRDTEYAHENEGEEHRKRNDRGDDQAGAGVAEEYYEDDEDDDGALDKVADDGRNVTADEL